MPIIRLLSVSSLFPHRILEAALIALMPFSLHVWLAVGITYLAVVLMNFLVDRTQEQILVSGNSI